MHSAIAMELNKVGIPRHGFYQSYWMNTSLVVVCYFAIIFILNLYISYYYLNVVTINGRSMCVTDSEEASLFAGSCSNSYNINLKECYILKLFKLYRYPLSDPKTLGALELCGGVYHIISETNVAITIIYDMSAIADICNSPGVSCMFMLVCFIYFSIYFSIPHVIPST